MAEGTPSERDLNQVGVTLKFCLLHPISTDTLVPDSFDLLREPIAINVMRWNLGGGATAEQAKRVLAAKDATHSGDCIDNPWPCLACSAQEAYRQADEIMAIIRDGVC